MIRRLFQVVAPVVTTGLLVAACAAKDDRTQVTLVFTSETEIPKELDALHITVTAANGSTVYDNVYNVRDPGFFATTLAIIPADEDSLKGPVTVEVKGLAGGAVGVQRRAIVSYVKDRTLMLPLPLRMACFAFKDCGVNSTCAGGTCQPATIDGASLRDFDESFVFETARDRCFDEDACLVGATPVNVGTDCTFPLPPEGASGERPALNVSVRWAAAENRIIVLDHGDAIEGWTVATDKPGYGRLSTGVCKSLLDPEPDPKKREVPDRALDARVSTRCPAKLGTQPYCRRLNNRQAGIGATIVP
ncbi:MAG: hypothetical protein JST00_37750 [Deltaproteobacteria bacterium]|nr:hypothetical protein [Deltaproteobacteria bacterium]